MATSGDLNWPPPGTFSWPWTLVEAHVIEPAVRELRELHVKARNAGEMELAEVLGALVLFQSCTQRTV